MVVFSYWVVLESSRFVRHTIAGLRAAVIAKAFLILSSSRLEASCIGEAGINMSCGSVEEQERKLRLQWQSGASNKFRLCLDPGRADKPFGAFCSKGDIKSGQDTMYNA